MFFLRFNVRSARLWRALGWLALPWWCASCAPHVVPPLAPPTAQVRSGASRLSMTATVGPQTTDAYGQMIAPRLPARATTPTAVAERRVGQVRMIGAGRRFVLIEAAPSAQLALGDGQELRCRSSVEAGGDQTALVRVSRERRQQFIVADVLDGQPHAGDSVYLAFSRSSSSSASASASGAAPPAPPPLLMRPAPDRPAGTVPVGGGFHSLFDPAPAHP